MLQNDVETICSIFILQEKQPALFVTHIINSFIISYIYAMAASSAIFIISVKDFSLSSEVDCSEVMK